MGDGKWFGRGRKRSAGGKRQSGGKAKQRRGLFGVRDRGLLSFEALEDRRMLANYLVNTGADIVDGAVALGSLRWAVNLSNASPDDTDTIVFADNVTSVGLNGGQLTLTDEVKILGPGPRKLTVSQGTGNSRIFETNIKEADVAYGVEISGMRLTGGGIVGTGEDRRGGAIFNREALTMREVVVEGNSASRGGGGIYTEFGRLNLYSSLIMNNTSNVGGGIMNGADGDEKRPTTTIFNSTLTGNTATGGGSENYPNAYGGGAFNRNGTMSIISSTITRNTASGGVGGGVASWGNPVPEEEGGDPPPATVFTNFGHTIAVGNFGADDEGVTIPSDVQRVGVEGEGEDEKELLPSVNQNNREGYNIVGAGNTTVVGDDIAFLNNDKGDRVGLTVDVVLESTTNPNPALRNPILGDRGGSTNVFMPATGSVAIDGGRPADPANNIAAKTRVLPADPRFSSDQRGRHFRGVAGAAIDIGSVEVQTGVFVVDTLVDETDNVFSFVSKVDFVNGQLVALAGYYDEEGDFSLREALQFAAKNPGRDEIRFSLELNTQTILEDEDLTVSPEPSIRLSPALGAITVGTAVDIIGPAGFVLEIDANDVSRVLVVDDGSTTTTLDVSISNLTFMNGFIVGATGGGGILSRENLTLKNSTIKENTAINSGGGMLVARGTTILEGVTFQGNHANNDGGGLLVDPLATLVKISNSTFSGNFAQDKGGAIFNDASNVAIGYSTITLNSAGGLQGSGIYNNRSTPPVPAMTKVFSTIISNNTASDVSFSAGATASSFESAGFNFVGTGTALSRFNQATDIQGTNPQLAPLATTGGIVPTHRPLIGSPVVDASHLQAPPGGTGFVITQPQYDQRLFPFIRLVDGNFDGVARIDIGSYELQGAVFEVNNLTDENDGDFSADNLSLREAIALSNENPFADTITFAALDSQGNDLFVPGITIDLGGSLSPGTPADMRITSSVTIIGNDFTIDASGLDPPSETIEHSRAFTIDDGDAGTLIDVTFSGLEIINAVAPQAGSVFWSSENLTLDGITLIDNRTTDDLSDATDLTGLHGGAVYQQNGLLRIIGDSLFSGNATDDMGADGGAIYVLNGGLYIENSTIAGNQTLRDTSRGGAIALNNSTFTGSAVTIAGNSTSLGASDGGGLFSLGSTVTLNDSSLIGGNSTTGTTSEGGGIAAIDSIITINDSVVSQNTTVGTQSAGAGAFVSGGAFTMNRSVLAFNVATGAQSPGGGIALAAGGVATFDASTVERNRVTGLGGHGGGVYNSGGTLIVRNSTVHTNEASHAQSKGGGVYSDTNMVVGAGSQSTTILNSTISGNTSGLRGGGVFNADGQMEIKHSTITNNATPFMNVGAGVASQGNPALPPPPAGPLPATTRTTVYSSIIAGNVGAAAETSTDIDVVDGGFQNSFQSLGYNVIGTGNALGAFGANDKKNIADPQLGPLANNGADPAMTYQLLTHEVLIGSPARDAGGLSVDPALQFDERGAGFIRVFNGRVDAGAFEFSADPIASDFNSDFFVDGTDFLRWQRNVGKTPATKADGDANDDDVVNGVDLGIFKTQYGSGTMSEVAVTVSSWNPVIEEELAENASGGLVPSGEASYLPGQPSSADASAVAGLGTPGTSPAGWKLPQEDAAVENDAANAICDATLAGLSYGAPAAVLEAAEGEDWESPWDQSEDESSEGESAEDLAFAAWDGV